MRVLAVIVGALALVCLGLGGWLLAMTYGFYWGPDYAPYSGGIAYRVGHVDADGSGIFVPSLLVLGLGIFLGKFALNLWRKP